MLTLKTKLIIFLSVLFLFSFGSIEKTFAATYYWVGSAGGSVLTAANWNTSAAACSGAGNASALTSADYFHFSSSCTSNASIPSNWNAARVYLDSGYTGTVTGDSGVTLTTTTTLTVGAGTLTLENLNIYYELNYYGGTINLANLTWSGDGYLYLSAAWTLTGNFTINNVGVNSYYNYPLIVNGNFVMSGSSSRWNSNPIQVKGDITTVSTGNTGAITINGTGNQTWHFNGSTILGSNNVVINKASGSMTFDGNDPIFYNFNVTSGTINLTNLSVRDLTVGASANITVTNLTTSYDLDHEYGGTLNVTNLTWTGDGYLYLAAAWTIAGNFTINNVGVNSYYNYPLIVSGDFTMVGSSARWYTNPMQVKGNITTTSIGNTGAITINGTGSQTWAFNGSGRFSNSTVTINKASGSLSFTGNTPYFVNFTVTAGTVSLTNLTLDGWLTVGASGNATITNLNTVNVDHEYGGTLNVTNLTYTSDGYLDLAATWTITGNLTINSNSSMNNYFNYPLIVNGNLVMTNSTSHLYGYGIQVKGDITATSGSNSMPITVNGTGSQTWYVNSSARFNSNTVTINKSSGSMTFAGSYDPYFYNFTVTAGTVNNLTTLNLDGWLTVGASGNATITNLNTVNVDHEYGGTLNVTNLTYTGGGYLDLGAAWTITGNLTINSNSSVNNYFNYPLIVNGNLVMTDSTSHLYTNAGAGFQIKGDLTTTSGSNGAPITVNGTGNQTWYFNNANRFSSTGVTVNKVSGSLTFAGSSTPYFYNFTVTAGTVNNLTTLNLDGWLTVGASGNATITNLNTVNVDHEYGGTLNVTNLTYTGNGYLDLAAAWTITGNLTIGGGSASMNNYFNYPLIVNGNLVMTDSNSHLYGYGIQVKGDITMTSQANTLPITVNGAGDQTWNSNVNLSYGSVNITVNKPSGTLTFSGTYSPTFYTFTFTAGSVDLNGRNFTETNALTIPNGGTLKLRGSETITSSDFTLASGSTVEYNATTSTQAIKNWTYTNSTLKINGSGATYTLPASVTVSNLNINAGTLNQGAYNITTSATGTITVGTSGTWSNTSTGDVTIGSGGVLNSGTITFDGGGTGGGSNSILIRSTSAGVARAWTGGGTFSMTDVNVKDQSSTPTITVISGTNAGNVLDNWVFDTVPPTDPYDDESLISESAQSEASSTISQLITSSGYYQSRTTSKDLLSGIYSSFQNFLYTVAKKPGGTLGKIQFSTDYVAGREKVLRFDGTNAYVNNTTANGDHLNRGNAGHASNENWTVSLWYKGTDISAGTYAVLGTGLVGWDNGALWASLSMGNGYPFYAHGSPGWNKITSSAFVADGSWHQIVYVNNSDQTGIIYVDGVNTGSGASTITGGGTYYQPTHIGATYQTSGSYTSGLIRDVRVYSEALSPEVVASFYAGVEPDSTNLNIRYKLDEGTGSSVANIGNVSGNGQVFGGYSWSIDESANNWKTAAGDEVGDIGAYTFNGSSDYIGIPHSSSLDVHSSDFSMGFWMKPGNDGVQSWLLQKGSQFTSYYQIRRSSTNKIVATVSSYNDGSYDQYVTNSSVTTGSGWVHVFATYTKGTRTWKVYINGVEDGQATDNQGSAYTQNGTAGLYIGSRYEYSNNYFTGKISDVRIYSEALSASTIWDLYANNIEPDDTNLEGHWKFNGNANDSSVNGNNGTVSGATNSTTWTDIPPLGNSLISDTDAQVASFDGSNDYVGISSRDWGIADTWTYSVWYKQNSATADKGIFQVGANMATPQANNFKLVSDYIYVSKSVGGILKYYSGIPMFTNKWTNVAVSWDGSNMKVYQNGADITSSLTKNVDNNGTMSNTDRPLYIGADFNTSLATAFNGLIGNVAIYNSAISPDQILTNFKNGYPDLTDSSLVSYWPLAGDYNDAVGSNTGINSGSTFVKDLYRPQPQEPGSGTLDISGFATSTSFYYRTIFDAGTSTDRTFALNDITLQATAAMTPIITVSATGTQQATTSSPVTLQYMGGAFALSRNIGSGNVSSITLTQDGTLATSSISQVRLYSETSTGGLCATSTAGATLWSTASSWSDNRIVATGTSPLTVSTTPICIYTKFSLTGTTTELTLFNTVDLEISNPSTDIVSDTTVAPSTAINILGSTRVTNTDSLTEESYGDSITIRMSDPALDPTIFYLKDDGTSNALYIKQGPNPTIRKLTSDGLTILNGTFTELSCTGNDCGGVKIHLEVQKSALDTELQPFTVEKTFNTTVKTRNSRN